MRVLINGQEKEITGGKVMVNGTAYNLAGGKTLIGGVAKDLQMQNGIVITFSVRSGSATPPIINERSYVDVYDVNDKLIQTTYENYNMTKLTVSPGACLECLPQGGTYAGYVYVNNRGVYQNITGTPYRYNIPTDAKTINVEFNTTKSNPRGEIYITEG